MRRETRRTGLKLKRYDGVPEHVEDQIREILQGSEMAQNLATQLYHQMRQADDHARKLKELNINIEHISTLIQKHLPDSGLKIVDRLYDVIQKQLSVR